jgi:hypothetical protein
MFWGMKDWWIKQIFSSPLQPVLAFLFSCFFKFVRYVGWRYLQVDLAKIDRQDQTPEKEKKQGPK